MKRTSITRITTSLLILLTVALASATARFALGWWSRGFLEGALLSIDADAAKKSDEFGLGVETAATRIVTYCDEHPTETPLEAVQYMLLDALK